MAPKKNLISHFVDGVLDLSLSGIEEVPVRDIVAIPKALNLDLSNNAIASLPKTFASSLTRLVILDLSQNQLTSLPDNFGLLVNLKHLDLDNNKLESLPLSFGNLKALRWLDLKHNPLMPKLAQIVGLCLDAQQCQAAARNVVAALHTMQEQVNAEITRRKEEQIKRIEKKEEIARNENKENLQSKKKKKKKAASAADNSSSLTDANGKTHLTGEVENTHQEENSLPSVPLKKTTQKPGLLRKLTSVLGTAVKFIVMSTLLVVFCGFALSLLDDELYTSVRMKVSEAIQSNIPKHYLKHWDNGMLMTRRAVVNWSNQVVTISVHWFNRIQDYAAAFSSNEVVQQYLESIKSGWHILWIWMSETYASICVELPHYYSSVKRIIFESSANKS